MDVDDAAADHADDERYRDALISDITRNDAEFEFAEGEIARLQQKIVQLRKHRASLADALRDCRIRLGEIPLGSLVTDQQLNDRVRELQALLNSDQTLRTRRYANRIFLIVRTHDLGGTTYQYDMQISLGQAHRIKAEAGVQDMFELLAEESETAP